MDKALKQRLIGAAVLIALAVIFVPMLLDGSGTQDKQAVDMKISAEPEFPRSRASSEAGRQVPPLPDDSPPASGLAEQQEQPASAAAPSAQSGSGQGQASASQQETSSDGEGAQASEQAKQSGDPAASTASASRGSGSTAQAGAGDADAEDNGGPGGNWVVQVGAFAKRDNALSLRERLRDAGFEAFIDPVSRGGERLHRVQVGPVLERAQAEDLERQLKRARDLDGLVMAYRP